MEGYAMEQKIKQDDIIHIGQNIRDVRIARGMKQVEVVRAMQLIGISMTRETYVKIERGIQHISASQLRAIKEALNTTYDVLLK